MGPLKIVKHGSKDTNDHSETRMKIGMFRWAMLQCEYSHWKITVENWGSPRGLVQLPWKVADLREGESIEVKFAIPFCFTRPARLLMSCFEYSISV